MAVKRKKKIKKIDFKSRTSFYKVRWKEVAALFVIDIFIFAMFAAWSITKCAMGINSTVVAVNHELVCSLVFFIDFSNIAYLFVLILVINFVLSAVWHFAVRKK